MGGKITSALSRETRELLKQNKFFYDSVLELGKEAGVGLKPRDGEAKTEVEQLSDGKVAIHILLPIDGNDRTSDGRIYLRDTFVFDAKQQQLHSHARSFEYNGRGENKAEWQKWLEQYRAVSAPAGEAKQAFAASAARSFSRAFQPKHVEVFRKDDSFYASLRGAVNELDLSPKLQDPRSSYAIVHRGLVTEIVFTIAMLDKKGGPGHLNLRETFLLDANTHSLVGYKRHIETAPGADPQDGSAKAAALNEVAVPGLDAARKFIGHFLPDLLSDLPEFKEAPFNPPPGGYPAMTPAMFNKVLGAMSRAQQAAPIAQLDPEFFTALDHSRAYLAPLREALGAGFELNLKDPPLQASVQVQRGQTQVFMTYSLRPGSGEAGLLEYTERWTFEGGQLSKVDRQAKALGASSGGEVETAARRLKEAIQGGKFGDAKDKVTSDAIVAQVGYLAPHLSYIGVPNLVEQSAEQATEAQRMAVALLEEIQNDLVFVQYQDGVDPAFREDLLRLSGAMIHGDQESQGKHLARLQAREEEALQSATDPERKKGHQENIQLANVLLLIHAGELDKAYQASKSLLSPAYKKIFAKHLELNVRVAQLTEGMALISKVIDDQIGVGERQGKGWLSGAPKYVAGEKEAIQGLLFKSMMTVQKTKSGDAMVALQAALDFGQDKKPEELKDGDKMLVLTEAERALANKVLADPLAKKLAGIATEEDSEIQAKEYFELARGKLFELGLVQTSHFLVQSVVVHKMPKSGASESLDILRIFAMEKSENAKVAKIEAMSPPPQELRALESLMKKVHEKAGENPSQPVLALLAGLADLSEDEQKLVARFQKNPALKDISNAASLPTVKQRLGVYQVAVQPLLTDHLLVEDVAAQLEKDPKLGLKQAFEKIPEIEPAQAQLLQIFEERGFFPKIDQALAAGVSMKAAERPDFYRKTLAPFLPNLLSSKKIEEILIPISQLEDKSQLQAAEGATLAPIVLALELEAEMLPQTKVAAGYARVAAEEQKAIHSLLDKAAAKAPTSPTASAYTILEQLKDEELSPAEKELRKQLLADKTIAALVEIGAEPDLVKRRELYLPHLPNLEKQPLEAGTLGKAGYLQADMWLAQNVLTGKIPDIRGYVEMPALARGQQPDRRHFAAVGAVESQAAMVRDVKKFLSLLEGKGDFGSKIGHGLPHFAKELTKPTSIAAMMAAPLAGGASSLVVFNKLKSLGIIGRGVAVGAGVVAEAGTFTYLHAKGEKHAYGNEAPEKAFWNDFKTNVALFGAMRGVHLGASVIGQRVLATGKAGKWAGSTVAGENGGSLHALPTQELAWLPSGGGIGVPQLTVNGERVVSLLNHGGALAAMYGVGRLSHAVGWQDKAPGFDDTLLMYLQAMAGYSLANSASGGSLASGIAGLKLRMDNVKGGLDSSGKKPSGASSDLMRLFESGPGEEVLAYSEGDASLKVTSVKAGESVSLDAALGKLGSDIIVKRDAEGKLLLEVAAQVESAADAPETVHHNGKPVTESVVLAEGDIISVEGKEVYVGLAEVSPIQAAMAQVPRAQQLGLAGQISKAKKIPQLFKILRDSPYGGAGEVSMVVAEVLVGRRSLSDLPLELGIKAKVEALLDGQVKEWKKNGLSSEGYALAEDSLPSLGASSQASVLEIEYHTLRALTSLQAGVESSRSLHDLLQAMGQSSLQTIGGVSTEKIFDSLGLESQRALLEQATKSEGELRQKIQIAERAIAREKKAWKRSDKAVIEINEKTRDELTEKADGLKQLVALLKAKVEAGDAVPRRSLSEIIDDLPKELGIRQKARDAVEQAQGDFAKSLSEREKKDFLEIAKRCLGAGEVEFNQAQSLVRSLWDGGNWQGQLLLSRLKPAQLELAFKVYFGSAKSRNLAPDRAFHLTQALAQTPLKESVAVVLSQSEGSARLDIVRNGEGSALKAGEIILFSTPRTKTKDIAITREELVFVVEQAQRAWRSQPAGEGTKPAPLQLSDSQLYFDPETRSFQTWFSHTTGLAKVRLTLDTSGELESVQIKYAVRPGEEQSVGLVLPKNFSDSKGLPSDLLQKAKVSQVDYQSLVKELPFEQKAPSWTYRALEGAAWIGDRIPSLPRVNILPKLGLGSPVKPPEKAKAEAASAPKTEEVPATPQAPEAAPLPGSGQAR